MQALLKDPHDASLFSNRSLCWLRLGDGEHALLDAQQCKAMRPQWPKAWYREGAALSLLKVY
jgi:tetratricopeptide (TPR) repeat protein